MTVMNRSSAIYVRTGTFFELKDKEKTRKNKSTLMKQQYRKNYMKLKFCTETSKTIIALLTLIMEIYKEQRDRSNEIRVLFSFLTSALWGCDRPTI